MNDGIHSLGKTIEGNFNDGMHTLGKTLEGNLNDSIKTLEENITELGNKTYDDMIPKTNETLDGIQQQIDNITKTFNSPPPILDDSNDNLLQKIRNLKI